MSELWLDTLGWMHSNLVVPDGEYSGEQFKATDEQGEFLRKFYATDAAGRRKVRRAQMTWPKGMGKSPIAAAIAAAEAKGPPAGPSPWVQIAGVSQDAAINTWAALLGMIDPENGSPFTRNYPDIDIGLTRIYMRNGRMEPVTAAAGTRRGQRVTFAVLDESSLWKRSNGGLTLAETIRDNVAKMGGASLETTNAFVPGQGSVAERTWEARGAAGVLADWRTSDIEVERLAHVRKLKSRLEELYGSSHWMDLERLVEEAQDPDVDEANWRRMFSNELVAESDAWVNPKAWEAIHVRRSIPDGARIAVGFDGSRFDDATALVAVGIDDPVVQLLGLWEKPEHAEAWEVPYDIVDDTVAQMFERYEVARFYCDPPHWQDRIDAWAALYSSVYPWETYRSRQMAAAVDRSETAVRSGELFHDGNPDLTRHVVNTRFDRNRFGKRLRKEYPKSPDKIDAAVAMVLAVEARGDAIAAGETKKKYKVAAF